MGRNNFQQKSRGGVTMNINIQKAKEIAAKYCEYYDGSKEADSTSYNSAMEMADFKDNQSISELGGWHTEPPTEDGCYLAEAKYIPYKNSCFLVAEYDTNAQCWYDEAYENPIEIERWKRI